MSSFDVVGVGIACMDMNATVTSIPKIDENVMMLDFRKQMGGTVSTALASLQRLGIQTKYMGMLGDDEYGHYTLDNMRAEGIDMSAVRMVPEENSPFSFVMVDGMTGKRSIAFYPGCALTVRADCVDADAVGAAKLLHVDIATPAVFAACNAARDGGIPISVEANVLYPGLEELLSLGNIFISAREITGGLANEEDPVSIGRKLISEYQLDLVVVTLGADGSVAVRSDETASHPGFSVSVVDTTGAGDVFHGAYLYGFLKKWNLEKSLRFANAAAAMMCMTQTGWAGIPTLRQVEGFLQEQGSG